jgi:hypothetical protein
MHSARCADRLSCPRSPAAPSNDSVDIMSTQCATGAQRSAGFTHYPVLHSGSAGGPLWTAVVCARNPAHAALDAGIISQFSYRCISRRCCATGAQWRAPTCMHRAAGPAHGPSCYWYIETGASPTTANANANTTVRLHMIYFAYFAAFCAE